MNQTVIFGPPGTGKTTQLEGISKEMIDRYGRDKTAVLTFSKTAANEIKNRLNLPKSKRRDYIGRTLHSICYHLIECEKIVVTPQDKKEFCDKHNIPTNPYTKEKNDQLVKMADEQTLGGVMFSKFDYMRINNPENPDKNLPYIESNGYIIEKDSMESLFREWETFKKNKKKIDYTDMLMIIYKEKIQPKISCLIVDEFQDLALLHYEIFKLWKENCEEVYIAGDVDQSIFGFMGCKPDYMLNERKGSEIIKLTQTYRLPSKLVLFSQDLINKNKNREIIEVTPFKEGGCIVKLDYPNIRQIIREFKGKTYLLVPASYMVVKLSKTLTQNLIPHRTIDGNTLWDDEFILVINTLKRFKFGLTVPYQNGLKVALKTNKILRDGLRKTFKTTLKSNNQTSLQDKFDWEEYQKIFKIKLKINDIIDYLAYGDKKKDMLYNLMKTNEIKINKPNIYVGTIHSSKGMECNTAIIFSEITKKFYESYRRDAEPIRRMFYVGSTRSSEKNVIVNNYFGSNYMYYWN